MASKSQLVSAKVLAKDLEKFLRVRIWALEVSECEHLGAGGFSEVSAKFQSVGTWAREFQSVSPWTREASECENLGAVISATSQSVSTWALEVSAKSRRSFRVWALGAGSLRV